jgi:hypothetical protein
MIFCFVFAPGFHRVEHLGTAAACSILVVVMEGEEADLGHICL